MPVSVDQLIALVREFCRAQCPGQHPEEIQIHLVGGKVKRVSIFEGGPDGGIGPNDMAGDSGIFLRGTLSADSIKLSVASSQPPGASANGENGGQKSPTPATVPAASRSPALPITPPSAEDFEPTDFQVSIFHALEYHAYHAEDLAAELDCDRRTLWKKNGIKELMVAGWVALDKSERQLGYYRPDCPPRELQREDISQPERK